MRDLPRDLLMVLLSLLLPLFAVRAARPPPALGAPEPIRPCTLPIEVEGIGVGCPSAAPGLTAGDRLSVDRRGRWRRLRMDPARLSAWGAPVDLNRASPLELASLDGVGTHLAARIVLARPFATVEELAMVRGIGPRRLVALRPRLTVTNATNAE